MSKKIILEIENIGGFFGKTKPITLKKGLNIVKAPNAACKTSLIRALELASLRDPELKGLSYYMNLFANRIGDYAAIRMKGDIELNRIFRRADKDLVSTEGEPLTGIDGGRIAAVCFATPENTLINSILGGRSIRKYIEDFSDSRYYDIAIQTLLEIKTDTDRQHQLFRADLIRLEETQNTLNDYKRELEEKVRLLEEMPEIDEREVLRDKELIHQYEEKQSEKKLLDKEIREIRGKIASKEDEISTLESDIDLYRNRIEQIGMDRQKIHQNLNKVQKELDYQKGEVNKFKKEIVKLDDEIKSVNENFQKRQKYGEEKLCIACGQPLTLKQLQRWEDKLKRALTDFSKKLREAERRVEDLEDEKQSLNRDLQELATYEDRLKAAEKSRANRESEKNQMKKKLSGLEKKRNELEKEIEKLYKSANRGAFEIWKKREHILDQIGEIKTKIEGTKSRIKELEQRTSKADTLVTKIEFLNDAIQHMRKRKNEVVDAVRISFKERVNEIFKELKFKDFEEIEITPEGRVQITRRKKGTMVTQWPLEALSTSERITLAVAFLIAGKKEYLSDYPFFVLDELITSYDPARFEKIKRYLTNVTGYVVVTELADENQIGDKLIVEHIE